ncbi:MAG: thioredoxin family protein [Sphingobacterium sp.]|jgi:thiol-disulfide isomerase/thioredoxin|nr:thioredoxin family protein [Sphingobacterium sp.]
MKIINYKIIQGFILFIGLVLYSKVHAQPAIRALSIGDTVPDLAFQNLMNYDGQLSLGMLSDKLVIIDFWTTGCPSCISAIPELEQLQKEFSGKLQIIMVNPWEKKEAIEKRVSAMKILRPGIGLTTLPNAYGDTIWRTIFPHAGTPHHIWIYKNKMIASTNSYNATKEHIAKVLAGEKALLSQKTDLMLDGFNIKKNSLIKKAHPSLKPMFYSAFFRSNHGFGGGGSSQIDTINGLFISRFYNRPIIDLYKSAFGIRPYEKSRVSIEVADSLSLYFPNDYNDIDSWYVDNCFSYEIGVPIASKNLLQKYMQTDLNRYFSEIKKIEGIVESRQFPCWILKKGKGELNRQPDQESKLEEIDPNTVNYQNQTVASIYNALRSGIENVQHEIKIVNETDLDPQLKLSVIMPVDKMDFQKLKKSLNAAGLTIEKGNRKVDVLVIRTIMQ